VKINKHLNLVIPIVRADGSKLYVHSTPIASEVFDTFYKPIARAHAEITAGGYGFASGPRIAAKLLRDAAKMLNMWEGPTGVERSLIPEIERLTNVFAPSGKGWELIPMYDAVRSGILDPEDTEQVLNAIAYFTVGSHMWPRLVMSSMLEGAAELWGARISSLNATEFMKSLTTSTEAENSGAKAAAA
jgi:hypothetical protein